jgi:hypothetical protein
MLSLGGFFLVLAFGDDIILVLVQSESRNRQKGRGLVITLVAFQVAYITEALLHIISLLSHFLLLLPHGQTSAWSRTGPLKQPEADSN